MPPSRPSPREIARRVQPDQVRYHADIERAREEGRAEGRLEVRKEVITYLEQEYMKPGVERGTGKASAILEVTRGLSQFLKNKEARR